MTDYKHIVIAFLASTLLIAGLAGFTAYRNGEASNPFKDTSPLKDVEIPLSPDTTKAKATTTNQEASSTTSMHNKKAHFTTSEGNFTVELYDSQAPITTENFEKLASAGFYDTTKFHRVIDGFMIQGGDPNSKSDDTSKYGMGGPNYTIKDEFAPGLSNVRGTISMANAGPNTGGSQFFINLVPNVFLDGKHPVFGNVIEGMDVVDKIAKVAKNQRDVPLTPVVVKSVKITE